MDLHDYRDVAENYDAYLDVEPAHTTFFLENIMAAALRRGIPTRELWFSDFYSDPTLFRFANERIYNGACSLPFHQEREPAAPTSSTCRRR